MKRAERLAAVRAALQGQEDPEWLIGTLSLEDGFGLYLCECPSEGVAEVLLELLEEGLAEDWGDFRVNRLSGRWGVGFHELADDIVEVLRSGGEETSGTIWVVDASGSDEQNQEVWARMMAVMNQVRNAITRALNRPLLMLLPPWLMRRLPEVAPDLWSVRSVEIRPELGEALPPPSPLFVVRSYAAPRSSSPKGDRPDGA